MKHEMPRESFICDYYARNECLHSLVVFKSATKGNVDFVACDFKRVLGGFRNLAAVVYDLYVFGVCQTVLVSQLFVGIDGRFGNADDPVVCKGALRIFSKTGMRAPKLSVMDRADYLSRVLVEEFEYPECPGKGEIRQIRMGMDDIRIFPFDQTCKFDG